MLLCRSLRVWNGKLCGPTITEHAPRVLSLGLAAGKLHMFLLQHFPCVAVESVEISADTFRIAQDLLGLQRGVCEARTLRKNRLEPAADLLTDKHSGREGECRSGVIIADAWDYIAYRVTANAGLAAANLSTVLYDLIVFDVYDATTGQWDGTPDAGSSSPFVDRASSDQSLSNVRALLRPSTGIAVFHLHRDARFEFYYRRICEVFGADQVALFVVTENDCIVVAGKYKFRVAPRALTQQNTADLSGGIGDSVKPTATRKANDFESLHPCEEPLLFAHHAELLAKAYGFSDEMSRVSKFALNCADKADYVPPAPEVAEE